ncbi:MAG: FAD-dependent oxidoreductase [Pseudomonadales bacterium]|uniref:NAD(P)/FAD-dependent oxidoreductase n=1 Tax=Alcanivorax sp. MD8A TaxID=1177157 RepID=UPI000C9CF833|nr:FAD-dependent oxidoreductase [Alcanivorax sp. MD8A]MCG8438369.1 FAD-dependent oxidoreductase [Pseudomonadales bacterium]PNE02732.1 oxidoreductase [Alcanivorax sp. MD8A]
MADVLVIGGGIVGLLSALELTARQFSVTLIDAPDAVKPASWAGGGILSPLYAWRYSSAMNRLTVDAPSRYDEILCQLGESQPLVHKGGLWVEVSAGEMSRAKEWADAWGVSCKQASGASVMAAGLPSEGLYFPSVGNIHNPGLLKLLRDHLNRHGVQFENAVIERLRPEPSGGTVYACDGRRWSSGRILLSAGYASSGLLESLGITLPLFPAKGEMLRYQTVMDSVPAVMLTEAGYLIPRNDGSVLVGSTLRMGDSSQCPTVAGRYQLEALAERLCPSLAKIKPANHWAGVRPGSDRDHPYLGGVPGYNGIYAATGHYRNGLVAAPASARLIAQMMCGEAPFIDPEPYSLPSSSLSRPSFLSR